MSENRKCSIIIPCYNSELYIKEAILSAEKQTYKDIEIIVVNDGSEDNSASIICDLCKLYKNIKFIDEKENRGVVSARNLAIEKAEGEIILPLDADDKIHHEYVERAMKIFNENPAVRLVYSSAKTFGADNHIREAVCEENFSKIIYGGGIFCSSLFYKEDFIKFGGYKYDMNAGFEDWEFWLEYVTHKLPVKRIAEPMLFYRITQHETRSSAAMKSKNVLLLNIFQKYLNLYLNDDEFIDRVFYCSPSVAKEMIKLVKKIKKYRKLFQVFLYISIVLFLLFLRNFL